MPDKTLTISIMPTVEAGGTKDEWLSALSARVLDVPLGDTGLLTPEFDSTLLQPAYVPGRLWKRPARGAEFPLTALIRFSAWVTAWCEHAGIETPTFNLQGSCTGRCLRGYVDRFIPDGKVAGALARALEDRP